VYFRHHFYIKIPFGNSDYMTRQNTC